MAEYERNYYVICDDNCKFPSMTYEQILAAIAEATGATPTDVDDAFISKIRELNRNNNLRFWIGTTAEYNELANAGQIESNCMYIITDDAFGDDVSEAISDLSEAISDLSEEVERLLPLGNVTNWRTFSSYGESKGRYKIVGKLCFIDVNYTKEFSEGFTGDTFELPFPVDDVAVGISNLFSCSTNSSTTVCVGDIRLDGALYKLHINGIPSATGTYHIWGTFVIPIE